MALVAAVLALSGCATATRLPRAPLGGEPWAIPSESYPSQRLYRVKYRGPGEEAGFKLTFYLETADRYRVQASDSLGRKLWSLEVDGNDRALWLDHRRKAYCRPHSGDRLRVPIADLPLRALPKLLLGRLPAEPAAGLEQSLERIAFLDVRGQLWNGGLEDGGLAWWSLVEDGEAVVWWRREDTEAVFADLRDGQELRFSEQVRERLPRPLDALGVPDRYRAVACARVADR